MVALQTNRAAMMHAAGSHVPGLIGDEAGLIGRTVARTARKPAEKPHREFATPVPMGSVGWRRRQAGLASNFLGEISQMGGRDFTAAVPETFAMVEGRRVAVVGVRTRV